MSPTNNTSAVIPDTVLAEEKLGTTQRPLPEASTLPPSCYTSGEWYEREVKDIFLKDWLCIGRVDQVAKPGDYFTLDLLSEPLVVVRDDDGEIRVLSTICRHRAMEVVRGSGNRRSFQCPYHAWTYSLKGNLIGAPEMERTLGFDRKQCSLPELRTEVWEGFIFTNFDSDTAPLGNQLAGLSSLLKNYNLGQMLTSKPISYSCPWNWKVMVENFMECYHHIGIHRNSVEPLMPALLTETDDINGIYGVMSLPYADQTGAAEESMYSALPAINSLSPAERRRWLVMAVYPTHLFFAGPESAAYYQVVPEGPDKCTLKIYLCFPPATTQLSNFKELEQAAYGTVVSFNDEDMAANASIQRGLTSRTARQGRFCHLEKAVWQFARYWTSRILPDQNETA